MLRIYTASKLKHAAKWRQLCEDNAVLYAHARWLKHSRMQTPDTPENAKTFWLQDEQDVKDADVVLVYAESDDKLRGALVEAGIAIACGIPVIVVGEHEDYGTWQYHPGVRRMPSLASVIDFLKCVKPRYLDMKRSP